MSECCCNRGLKALLVVHTPKIDTENMPPDIRGSLIHISAKNWDRVHRGANVGHEQRFTCFRCRRPLPESQYELLFTRLDARLNGPMYFHPFCWTCRQQAKNKLAQHALYSPAVHRFCTELLKRTKSACRDRGLAFALADDDVLESYLVQEGKCALSGVRMSIEKGTKARRTHTAISIDRINSERNYTRDNIQLVCAVVNVMKTDMSVEELRFWCAQIVLTNAEDDDESDLPITACAQAGASTSAL